MITLYQICPHCGQQTVPLETLKAVLRSAAVMYGYLKGLQNDQLFTAETVSVCELHGLELFNLYNEVHS